MSADRDPLALGGRPGDNVDAETRHIAALEFDPVDNAVLLADLTEPTWSAIIADIAIYLRLAAATNGNHLRSLADVLKGAFYRMNVAASVVVVEREGGT
jgi:hypothetical protein